MLNGKDVALAQFWITLICNIDAGFKENVVDVTGAFCQVVFT